MIKELLKKKPKIKSEVKLIKFLKFTPGGQHAWFETNEGINVRKPINGLTDKQMKLING